MILNVDNRFEKLAGFTTEGKKVKFYGHSSKSKNTSPKRKIRLSRKPLASENSTEFFLRKHKEEQTKSM